MPFVSDTFTGSDGTALTSHTGEVAATWTRHTSYSAFTVPNIQGNRLAPNDPGNNNVVVYPSGSPGTADYHVQGDYWFTGVKALGLSLVGRLDTAADTFYWARHNPSTNNWELIKRVTGANTTLGTFNDTGFTTGVTRAIKLEMIGTAIKVYVDGTQQISVTDSAISAAGKAGVLAQGDSSAGRIRLDNFVAADLTVPGAGTIGTATVDRFARVTLPFTKGTGGLPESLKLYRSADNVTFVDISSQVEFTDNGSGSWTVIDRRPHAGSQPVPTYGGTGYYKITGVNGGGEGTATSVKTVASVDIDRNSCEQNRAATVSGIMAGSSVASNANEKYPGYHCTAMAYAYFRFGTAQYKTDCLSQFGYIQGLDTADGLIKVFGETDITRDSHCRTVVHVVTAARLLRFAGATTDAATMIAQCDIWAKAFFDNLNSGTPAPALRFSGWDANNTTGFNAQTVWQATHAYTLGEVRRPTSTNNRTYRVTTAGTSGGSEPTWPTTDGGTVTDGSVGWTETSVTVACSYSTYSASAGHAGIVGQQQSDLNQQAQEALMCASLMADPDSAFFTAGSYRTKATNHLSAAVQIILAHETSIGAIPIGTASGETAIATTSKRYYDTLYGNYMLQQISAVQSLQPSLNPYLAGFISRAFDYAVATYYGTEPPSRRRYSVAEPGLSSSVPFYDLVYLDAAAVIAGRTNPQSKLVWTTAFQLASSDKVTTAGYVSTGTTAPALANEIQAEMLDGPAYATGFFPPTPSTATTLAATDVAPTSAVLNATVNPNGDSTTAEFEWGTTTSYGNTISLGTVGSDSVDHALSTSLTGLTTGTTYHYRISATNGGGTSHGADQAFTPTFPSPLPNRSRPPLALSVVAIAADGSETTWWSGDKYAANRPQQLTFRTRIGEGFSDASCSLPRRVDRDYNDLELFNDIVAVGDDGQIAYEARIGSTPRSTSGGHSIQVQCAGWMAHARDRKFTEDYVNRDIGAWGATPLNRRAAIITRTLDQDYTFKTERGLIFDGVDGKAITTSSETEAWYAAPDDVLIAALGYVGTESNTTNVEAATFTLATDDAAAASTNAALTLDGAVHTATPTTPARYAFLRALATGTHTPAAGSAFHRTFTALALYGNHGLARHAIDASNPDGLYASDVITNIAQRFCPKLKTTGVEGTTLVIPHIAFRERTTPFDAFLVLNGPHGYELAVWENKTLYFRPYDLSDYDWQVRMDQPGVDLSLQGDTTDQLANYVVVEFDNVATGQRDQVTPSDDSSLEDTTVDHPANTHGLDVELTVGLTFPTTQAVAIAFGQSYLNEFNRPKNRGQITVEGHILDRAGHWIQPWMVRAGQTISVVDHPNDTPRLITETSYDHASRTVTISTDNGELNMVEAVVDYIRTSLT